MREIRTNVTTCLHDFLLNYLGLSKSQNNTLHSCCSNCDDMRSVPHKKLTPKPSDPVKKVSEEQCKIRSRLLKKYWLEHGSKISRYRLKHRMYNFVGWTHSG